MSLMGMLRLDGPVEINRHYSNDRHRRVDQYRSEKKYLRRRHY
jgi:hypothetical protein